MKSLTPLVVAALCAACSAKNEPEPAAKAPAEAAEEPAEKPTADKPAEQAAPEKPAEKAAPEKPAGPVALVAEARAFGPLNEKTPFDEAALKAAMTGYTLARVETEAEGDTYVSYSFSLDGKPLGAISEGHGGLSVVIDDPSIKDAKGIGLGSTHRQLMAAWPDAKCELFVLEQPTDGVEPFESIDCKLPQAQSIWYRIDVTDLEGLGKTMPEAEVINDRPITRFTADYPPLGGWK